MLVTVRGVSVSHPAFRILVSCPDLSQREIILGLAYSVTSNDFVPNLLNKGMDIGVDRVSIFTVVRKCYIKVDLAISLVLTMHF